MIKVFGQIRVKRLTGVARISTSAIANIKLEDKTVIPTAAEQIIEAGKAFDALGVVTVAGEPNFVAENIKLGVTMWGVEGKASSGSSFFCRAVGQLPLVYRSTARSGFPAFTSQAVGTVYVEPGQT